MNKLAARGIFLAMIATVTLALNGCSGGGAGAEALPGHTGSTGGHTGGGTGSGTGGGGGGVTTSPTPAGPTGCDQVSPAAPSSAGSAGFFSGAFIVGALEIGQINFEVNSAGVMVSGRMLFPNGQWIQWTAEDPWPAGNPGIGGTEFVTSDCAEGGIETFQGWYNPILDEYRGTFGSTNYPLIGSIGESFVARRSPGVPFARQVTEKMKGSMVSGATTQPMDVAVQLYGDRSAVVTVVGKDGRAIMIVGKQVGPKGVRKMGITAPSAPVSAEPSAQTTTGPAL